MIHFNQSIFAEVWFPLVEHKPRLDLASIHFSVVFSPFEAGWWVQWDGRVGWAGVMFKYRQGICWASFIQRIRAAYVAAQAQTGRAQRWSLCPARLSRQPIQKGCLVASSVPLERKSTEDTPALFLLMEMFPVHCKCGFTLTTFWICVWHRAVQYFSIENILYKI